MFESVSKLTPVVVSAFLVLASEPRGRMSLERGPGSLVWSVGSAQLSSLRLTAASGRPDLRRSGRLERRLSGIADS
jgi:hypothetical protein